MVIATIITITIVSADPVTYPCPTTCYQGQHCYIDADKDGFSPNPITKYLCNLSGGCPNLSYQLCGTTEDCNDNDPNVPIPAEICGDNIDNDCNSKVGFLRYVDLDGDGVPGDPNPICAEEDMPWYVSSFSGKPDCNDTFAKNVYSHTIGEWDRLGKGAIYIGSQDAFSEHSILVALSTYLMHKMGANWIENTQWDCDGRNSARGELNDNIITAEAVRMFYSHIMGTARIFMTDREILSFTFTATSDALYSLLGLSAKFWPSGETTIAQGKTIIPLSYYTLYLDRSEINFEVLYKSVHYFNLILALYATKAPWFLGGLIGDVSKKVIKAHGASAVRSMQKAVHQSIFAYMGREGRGSDIISFLDGYGCYQGVLSSPHSNPSPTSTYVSPLTMLTCILSEHCVEVASEAPDDTVVIIYCYDWKNRENVIKSYAFSSTPPLCKIRTEQTLQIPPPECSLVQGP